MIENFSSNSSIPFTNIVSNITIHSPSSIIRIQKIYKILLLNCLGSVKQIINESKLMGDEMKTSATKSNLSVTDFNFSDTNLTSVR